MVLHLITRKLKLKTKINKLLKVIIFFKMNKDKVIKNFIQNNRFSDH